MLAMSISTSAAACHCVPACSAFEAFRDGRTRFRTDLGVFPRQHGINLSLTMGNGLIAGSSDLTDKR